MKTITREKLQTQVKNKKWVMAYNTLEAIHDERSNKIMYIETYGPPNGFFIEGWRALHYKRTSPLVEKTYREGNTTICILKQGRTKLQLIPSFAPFGIESCFVKKNEVHITFSGLGGAGVSVSYSRGLAKGVLKIIIASEGGGAKVGKSTIVLPKKRMLLIGVDDTDNDKEGATYSLVHNIAQESAELFGVDYRIHVNIQHYPYNEKKTKNCMSTVVGLIFQTDIEKNKIIQYFKKELKQYTLSKNTAMAVYEGFEFSQEFLNYCYETKFGLVNDVDAVIKLAQDNGIELYQITGKNGIVGSVASLGYFDQPDFAAKLPSLCR